MKRIFFLISNNKSWWIFHRYVCDSECTFTMTELTTLPLSTYRFCGYNRRKSEEIFWGCQKIKNWIKTTAVWYITKGELELILYIFFNFQLFLSCLSLCHKCPYELLRTPYERFSDNGNSGRRWKNRDLYKIIVHTNFCDRSIKYTSLFIFYIRL